MKIKRLPNYKKLTQFVDVGHRISVVRNECGLSQEELAKIIGKESATAISLYENGKRYPNSINLQKIAFACNVSISEII